MREHSVVALSGESADEVFGGYPWFHDRRAIDAGTFPWLAGFAVRTGVGSRARDSDPDRTPARLFTGILDPDLISSLEFDTYRRDTYEQAVNEVDHLSGEDPTEHRSRSASPLLRPPVGGVRLQRSLGQ